MLNAQRGGAAFSTFIQKCGNDPRCLFVFQNILLVGRLPWVIVVNDIGHSIFISPVRHYTDMSFKNHDITALPLFLF